MNKLTAWFDMDYVTLAALLAEDERRTGNTTDVSRVTYPYASPCAVWGEAQQVMLAIGIVANNGFDTLRKVYQTTTD